MHIPIFYGTDDLEKINDLHQVYYENHDFLMDSISNLDNTLADNISDCDYVNALSDYLMQENIEAIAEELQSYFDDVKIENGLIRASKTASTVSAEIKKLSKALSEISSLHGQLSISYNDDLKNRFNSAIYKFKTLTQQYEHPVFVNLGIEHLLNSPIIFIDRIFENNRLFESYTMWFIPVIGDYHV